MEWNPNPNSNHLDAMWDVMCRHYLFTSAFLEGKRLVWPEKVEMSRRSSRAASAAATQAVSSSSSLSKRATGSSSSSSSSLRQQQNGISEDIDKVVVEGGLFRRVPKEKEKRPCDKYQFGEITGKKADAWTALDAPTKERCITAVSRYMLFKGSRNETVSSTKIRECLSEIDKSYAAYALPVLKAAAATLKETFGFRVNQGNAFVVGGDSDKYYIHNTLESPYLLEVLAQHQEKSAAAFKGFCFVIFQAIWASPAQEATGSDLLRYCNRLDERFPTTYLATDSKSGAAYAVPELGAHFHDLLVKMAKEDYIKKVTEDVESRNAEIDHSQTKYKLGARFFNECGKKQLAYSYFNGINNEPDEAIMEQVEAEIINDDKKIRNDDEDDRAEKKKRSK